MKNIYIEYVVTNAWCRFIYSIEYNIGEGKIYFKYRKPDYDIEKHINLNIEQRTEIQRILSVDFIKNIVDSNYSKDGAPVFDGYEWHVSFLNEDKKCIFRVNTFDSYLPPDEFNVLFEYVKEIAEVKERIYRIF